MVGDVCTVGGEGTKLLIHYVRNGLPSDYIPIVFDNLGTTKIFNISNPH